jgi:hypothetical protein
MLQVGHHVSTRGAPGAGESGHRVAADSPRRFGVAGAVLNHAAAIRRAGKNFIARAETVQDFEAKQRDMRRLEDVAAEIHYDVRGRDRPRGGRLGEAGKEIGRKLQTRQHLYRAGHFFEAGLAGAAPFARLAPLVEPQAGRRQHETRINAVIAGRETTTGAGARVGPAGASARWITAAAQNIQHIADDRRRLAGIDPCRRRRGTNLDAFRAAGAAVKNIAHAQIDGGDECISVIGHSFSFAKRGTFYRQSAFT